MQNKTNVAGANGLKEISLPFLAMVSFAYAWNFDVVERIDASFYGIGQILSIVLFLLCLVKLKLKMSWKAIWQSLKHDELLTWCAGVLILLLIFLNSTLLDKVKAVISAILLVAAFVFLIYWVVLLCKKKLFRL